MWAALLGTAVSAGVSAGATASQNRRPSTFDMQLQAYQNATGRQNRVVAALNQRRAMTAGALLIGGGFALVVMLVALKKTRK